MKFIALLLSSAVWMAAVEPAGFRQWSTASLQDTGKRLAAKMDQNKIASEGLANFGNHSVMVLHREATGQAELHETQADIFVVQSGEGTLVVGGTVVDSKTVSPHEVRGPSIKDGVSKRLSPGDIVHIAAKTPHQLMVPAGKEITYLVVKVDTP